MDRTGAAETGQKRRGSLRGAIRHAALAGTSVVALATMMGAPSDALAQTWTGAGGNSTFGNTANWSSGSVPGLGNTMTINNANLANYPIVNSSRVITQSNISAGSLTISNNATLTSNMNITGTGLVTVDADSSLEGTITVGTGGTLRISEGLGLNTNLRLSGSGQGQLGALRSTASVSVRRTITLLANTQLRSESGTLDLNGITGSGFNLTAAGNGSFRFNSPIDIGTGSLILNGSATSVFALTGANTFTGPIEVNGGSLQVSGGNNVINDTTRVILAGGTFLQLFASERIGGLEGSGTVSIGANQTFTFGDAQDHTFSGSIIVNGGGVHNITKEGTGTQILTGFVQHGGETRINAGRLQLGDGGTTLNFSATGPIVNNAALEFNHSGFLSIFGAISGTGTVTQRGTGVTVLRSLNTYSGQTTIAGGALRANVANAFSALSAVSITGANASLDLGGFNQTIGSLSGVASSIVRNGVAGNSTLTTGGDNSSTTFSGLIQNGFGTLSLVKTGTGNFTLTGSNT